MRVGVIGPTDPDSFADNISATLTDMGQEAVALGPATWSSGRRLVDTGLDLASRAYPQLEQAQQRRLAERALAAQCQLIISVSARLLPNTVDHLRSDGSKVVLWFPDAVSNLDRQLMLIASYDRIYFKEPLLVDRLRALTELPVAYLAEACNALWHFPQGPAGSRAEIVVAGNMYPSRVRLLDRLHADGVPLAIYGAGFPKWMPERPVMQCYQGRSIVRHEKAQVFRRAAGVLNNLHPSEISGLNCRMFEAAGSGAAVLCEQRTELGQHFEDKREVLAFQNYDELLRQCHDLLGDPRLVETLGDAASARALADHTYHHRLASILSDVT